MVTTQEQTTREGSKDDAAAVSVEDVTRILAGSPDRAAAWVRTAAAQGVAEAQAIYGQMLLDGRGVTRDPLMALHWFERAALGGHVMAMNMVGRSHEHGWGVARSAAIAAQWYAAAAERGLDWGMYNLATLLTLGQGLPRDRAAALRWYRKAAALGHAKSINLIGGFYEDGWEVARDRDTARDHYRRAAEGGDFRGQFNYARLLGEDGQTDEAMSWLRRVPSTATASFLRKMTRFLLASPIEPFREFGEELAALGYSASA
jgi:TPR repeat protein